MLLYMMLQNTSTVIMFTTGISLEDTVCNKQIINEVTWSATFYHILWIFLDLTHDTWYSTSCDILL